jgi:predicted DNA-binding transcriptional regulator AlpA
MVDRPKGKIVPWLADRLSMPREELLGTADIATRLGVTRQRVAQLRGDDPTFPRSFSGYGRARAWRTAGIECWAAAHRPERPEAGGRFLGEAAALLLAAEAHAHRLNVHWVDSGLFWLSIASGAAGAGLEAAVDSMGVTAKEIEDEIGRWRGSSDTTKRVRRMNPHVQSFLAAADRSAAKGGRANLRALDVLLAFIDAKWERHGEMRTPRPPDHLLDAFNRRGLDIDELRRRLVAADADATSPGGFEQRRLKRFPRRRPTKPRFELAPDPLGHDPWTRSPWGAAFARTRDGRHLTVDGEVWFFKIDGDGFYIRSSDGRPVGYRYPEKPRIRAGQQVIKPVNGFMEILPMPPVEMADWPDRRFLSDE